MMYNELAEQSVIKAIISDGKKDLIQQLRPQDFYFPQHQKIMAAVMALYDEKKPVDAVTVDDTLTDSDAKQALIDITFSSHYPTWESKSHVQIIKDCAMRRSLYNLLDNSQHDLTAQGIETAQVLEGLRQGLRNINSASPGKWLSMRDVMQTTYNEIGERQKNHERPMPFGIKKLDAMTGGLHRGELTVIAARPAVGKSAFALQIALQCAAAGYKVAVISREMTAAQYGSRILQGSIDKPLRTAQLEQTEWERLSIMANDYSRKSISFLFSVRYIEDLAAAIQREMEKDGIDVVLIDYLQLMQTKQRFQQDYQRIGYISKSLKDIAVDCNIAVVALAQLKRAEKNAMPTMNDLRGSGDIEQDADNIVLLHRPSSVNDKCVRYKDFYNGLAESKYTIITVEKQRQGNTGRITAVFNPQKAIFTGIEHE